MSSDRHVYESDGGFAFIFNGSTYSGYDEEQEAEEALEELERQEKADQLVVKGEHHGIQ